MLLPVLVFDTPLLAAGRFIRISKGTTHTGIIGFVGFFELSKQEDP
jgi:hypothetical protein